MKKLLFMMCLLFSVSTSTAYAQVYFNKLISQSIEEGKYVLKYSNVYNHKILQDKFGHILKEEKIRSVISVLDMGQFSVLVIEEYKKLPVYYILCTEPIFSGDSEMLTDNYYTQWEGMEASDLEKHQNIEDKEDKGTFMKAKALKFINCAFSKIEEAKTNNVEAMVLKPVYFIGDETIYYRIKD